MPAEHHNSEVFITIDHDNGVIRKCVRTKGGTINVAGREFPITQWTVEEESRTPNGTIEYWHSREYER